jgi:hypothetical protein
MGRIPVAVSVLISACTVWFFHINKIIAVVVLAIRACGVSVATFSGSRVYTGV